MTGLVDAFYVLPCSLYFYQVEEPLFLSRCRIFILQDCSGEAVSWVHLTPFLDVYIWAETAVSIACAEEVLGLLAVAFSKCSLVVYGHFLLKRFPVLEHSILVKLFTCKD